MKAIIIYTSALLVTLYFAGCDYSITGPFDFSGTNITEKFDTITFQLDSLSVWDTSSSASNIFTHSFQGKLYSNIQFSFYGATNIDTTPGDSAEIEYCSYLQGQLHSQVTLQGYDEINKYYTSRANQSFIGGDSVSFCVRFSGVKSNQLKYVKISCLWVTAIHSYFN